MGRVGVDLYPTPDQVRRPLSRIDRYDRFVGGFAGNVATGLARLGIRTAIASRVGDDGHGRFVHDFLVAEGVGVQWLVVDTELRTALAFCEVWPPDRFPITFYRTPTCPDWRLSRTDLDLEAMAQVPLLYVTGTGLARSPSRETTIEAMTKHTGRTIFDLDHRGVLWEHAENYRLYAMLACRYADVVVGNSEEVMVATGVTDERAAATAILSLGPSIVFAKRGQDGCAVHEAAGTTEVRGFPVQVSNGLGAGDAFAAALGYGLLLQLPLERTVALANAAGAMVATKIPCSAAMPSLSELEAFLEERRG